MKPGTLSIIAFCICFSPMTAHALDEDENHLICSMGASHLDVMEEFFLLKEISLDVALTQSRCELRTRASSDPTPYGRMLHRSVSDGSDMVGIVTNALRYLKGKPRDERLEIFETVLDGLEGHRTLLEETLVAYEHHEDKRTAIVGTARRLCKAIRVFEFEDELSHYLNDPIGGCRNPAIAQMK